MTYEVADRVYETSVTTGTGTYTLDGPVTGFQAFSALGANNYCPYFATDGIDWEVGIGRALSGPERLERTTVLSSSNSDAAVDWGAGTKNLRCGLPALFGAPRVTSKSVAGSSNVTLTQEEQRCDVLVLTGALTGNIDVIVDATVWKWSSIYNNTSGGFTVTFKVTGQTGVLLKQGYRRPVIVDGTDARYAHTFVEPAPLSSANKKIFSLTYANGTDATNDINIFTGGAMDATGAYWMSLAANLGKQSDVAWAVGGTTGAPAGFLDTGSVGNNEYYIWLIARSDTGVVDALCSLSVSAPTMPANYDYKRLIGWFKRAGGTVVAFHTYETEGGGLEFTWDVPTLDINLANTLTTSRRTDTLKVPQGFSTVASFNLVINDAGASVLAQICCPDQADAAPSLTVAPLAHIASTTGKGGVQRSRIRTSATGTIAARADVATVDLYAASTSGFEMARNF